nr:iron-containing alcohol dehydrogenase [Candidatus Bathyarchaeota archaeon]
YLNRQWANDLTDALAVKAIQLVLKFLPVVYRSPRNLEARGRMQLAATIAGLAFGNSGTSITHALGHSLGKIFNIHHGKAVGMFVPYSLRFEAKVTDAYVELAKYLDITASTKEEYLDKLTQLFKDFITGLNVPVALKDLGISREEYEAKKEVLVKYAFEDPTTIFSLRPVSVKDYEKLFDYAYEGKDVDW